MKNLNLKWLRISSKTSNNPDGHPTADRQSRLLSVLSCLFLLLTLGVGQMWADNQMGFENSDNGVKFSKSTDGGSSYSDYQVSHGRTNTTQDGGAVTNLYLKEYFVYLYQNVNNLTGTTHLNYWFYRTNIGKGEDAATQFGGNWGNWKVDTQDNDGWDSGWRHPKFGNNNISNDGGTTNVNLLSGQGSGHYTFEYYFDAETNGGWSTLYCSNTDSKNFKVTFTYNIVPAVSSYAYSTTESSSILSGSGTPEDPYIISYNGSLKITQSGSKASADANSEPYYKFGDGDYGTTAYTTISNITSTSKTSIEVKMKYYNSTDDLSGTESSATIYYKSEPAYTVTVNNDGHGTTSPSGAQSNIGASIGIAISANPNDDYEFVNWTIESGTGSFEDATNESTTFYPTDATTIQANFRSTLTNSLTVSAGTHVTTVSGSQNSVTLGSKYAINATAFETGYEFLNWTASPAANAVFDDLNSASTNVTVKNGSVTVTANAKEVMSSLSTSNSYVVGNPGYDAPTKSVSSIGISTTATITATAAGTGYMLGGWTITNGTRTDGGDANATTITVRSNGDGSNVSVVANYEEDLSSPYVIKGGTAITGSNWGTNLAMEKATGHSTESVVYYTLHFTEATPNGDQSTYNFKIVKVGDSETYYGIHTENDASNWWYMRNHGKKELTTAGGVNNNIQLRADGEGDYVVKVDYTDADHPTITITFPVDGNYDVTLRAGANGSVENAGTVTIHSTPAIAINATPNPGYRFNEWTVTGANAGNVSINNVHSASTTVHATGDASGVIITANFTNEGFIYFDRSAVSGVWSGSDVYFTVFDNNYQWYRHNDLDQALIIQDYVNNAVYNKRMNRIPNTNIYYYDISGYSTYGKIIFTDKSQPAAGNALNAMACAPRGDFQPTQNNMFVVENYVTGTHNRVGEFDGYWMKYNETGSGIELHVYNQTGSVEVSGSPIEFTNTNAGDRQFTASISLSGTTAYKFKIKGWNGMWYGNNGTMTASSSTAWDFWNRTNYDCNFTTTGEGSYKFTLVCTDAGVLKVSLDFPLDKNDYQLVYNGKINTKDGSTHAHPSKFIRNVDNGGSGEDIVSFFVTGDWSVTLQKCTDISGSTITWSNACASSTLTAADLGLAGKTGVYTFKVTQGNDGGCDGITISEVKEYTGDYYIRTDVAGGGWEAYETTPDNKLEFSSYSKEHSDYDYYYCHWAPTGKNIYFTIANDYSPCITDTLRQGVAPFNFDNLPYEASVRFMYNSETNIIGRVYLNGSNEGQAEYLSLHAMNDSIRINESTPVEKSGSENHLKLQDMGNWIYQKDIQVHEGTHYRLISNYRYSGTDHLQYFKGEEGTWNPSTTELLLGGTSDSYQTLRIVYDYKTNHLVAAWLVPETGNSPAIALETNVMILQQNQDTARQITFAGSNDALTEIDTVYSAVHLTKDFMWNNLISEAARKFFYVSFPYDVDLSDVFGSVGEYGVDWAIQWYDGKKRAREGFWADSEPNWKFFETAKGATLRAYEGYVLTLNLNKFLDDSKWKYDVTDIYLYFPSKDKIGTIHNESSKTVRVMPEGETATDYTCTINRATPDGDRTRKDSHWHCIGSPSFARNNTTSWNTHDGTSEDWKAKTLPFLYEWNSTDNVMEPVAAGGTYKFKPLTAYLVQYEGPTITWNNVVTPAFSIVARRASETPDKETTFTLSLLRGEEKMDQTFVRISENEGVTSGFEFGQDLCKEFQRGANIYTIVENTELAGNSLPLETEKTTTVPVGVRITAAGEYTFAMPEGTNGIGAVLVDTENGTRTNLALGDYTVTLGAGTTDGRFVLEISPVAQTPTGIGNVQGDDVQRTKAHKVMVDGVLYIVKDGKAYDACGTRVR